MSRLPTGLVLVPALFLTAGLGDFSRAAQDDQDTVEAQIAVLQSDASLHDKSVACKRLAVLGSADAVAALAAQLPDERLSHFARFGLEPIDDPAVDAAFRDALDTLEGEPLIGVINSVGNRRDADAVPRLTEMLDSTEPRVAAAAAEALGDIAVPEAIDALTEALAADGDAVVREAAARAALVAAERLTEQGERARAIQLIDAVRETDVGEPVRIAALYAALMARGHEELELLNVSLSSEDEGAFEVALQAARQLSGDDIVKSLIAALQQPRPQRAAALVTALGERDSDEAAMAVRAAAQPESPDSVQAAAVRALRTAGDASDVPMLMQLALSGEDEVADVAFETLARLPGGEVDAAILGQASGDGPSQDALVLRLAGRRRITDAQPQAVAAATSRTPMLRQVGLETLGEIGTIEALRLLIDRAQSGGSDAEAARTALVAACMRMPDQTACVEALESGFRSGRAELPDYYFDLLREVGGDAALARAVDGARSRDDAVQDAATRVLGEWATADAAPELLELARTLDSNKYKIRAMRGYIRIIRQFGLPTDERVAMARRALEVAERDEERKLVLEALGRFPAAGSLEVATEHLDNPALRGDAARAAVAIAERLVEQEPEAARSAMNRVLEARVGAPLQARARAVVEKTSGN